MSIDEARRLGSSPLADLTELDDGDDRGSAA